eukprot:3302664-Pyramimonas_sp.AAC.1
MAGSGTRDPSDANSTIHHLIDARRAIAQSDLPQTEKKALRISIGKRIQSLIRHRRVLEQTAKIDKILHGFRDVKQIPSITRGRPKSHITEMKDKAGQLVNEKHDIAEVFAQFYEELYASTRPEHSQNTYSPVGDNRVPPFTMEELKEAMRQLKLHKAADDNG